MGLKRRVDRENYQNNENDRKKLEQSVSNGEELHPMMKAQLIKLTAATANENYPNKESDQQKLDQVSNDKEFHPMMKTQLIKLTAANENCKKTLA